MNGVRYAPLAAFVFAAFTISVSLGFSSPIIIQPSSTRRASVRGPCGLPPVSPRSIGKVAKPHHHHDHHGATASTTTSLPMGVVDFLRGKLARKEEEGDFIRIDRGDDDTFGPGPLILMYAVPDTMDDGKLKDMVENSIPGRVKEGIVIRRMSGMGMNREGGNDALLDLTVEEALNEAMGVQSNRDTAAPSLVGVPAEKPTTSPEEDGPCPVLYFSGISNSEMMETYETISNEIYEETSGVHWPACAKVVPPAMAKSMRWVLTEISEDHADAMRMRKEEVEGTCQITEDMFDE